MMCLREQRHRESIRGRDNDSFVVFATILRNVPFNFVLILILIRYCWLQKFVDFSVVTTNNRPSLVTFIRSFYSKSNVIVK